ncbi:MAG TPA: hypothetical protein PKE40_06420 [Arachnia sp.]|nr:hypothetical protein [Arachnia sp.]HMT85971.1 hypothetical protein [Arachnia sp.]
MAETRLNDLAASAIGTPLFRASVLLGWAMLLINGAVTGFLRIDNPAAAIAFAGGLCAVLLVTSPQWHRLRPLQAWTVVAIVLVFVALSLFFDGDRSVVSGLPYLGCFLLGWLVVRGNTVIGTFGSAVLLGLFLAWGLRTDAAATDVVSRMAIAAVLTNLGHLWSYLVDQVAARELMYRAELADATLAADRAVESAKRTADDLRSIRDEAQALLERLRDDGRISTDAHQELVVTEASIRDRIRVPRLLVPELRLAIRRARERFVSVHLVGEATDVRPAISEPLGLAVADLLDGMDEGEITIRIPPPHARPARDDGIVLTVHIRTDAETVLVSYDRDGEVVRRR